MDKESILQKLEEITKEVEYIKFTSMTLELDNVHEELTKLMEEIS